VAQARPLGSRFGGQGPVDDARPGVHEPMARAMNAIMMRNAPRAAISVMSRRA
jgi:hypothetical protein